MAKNTFKPRSYCNALLQDHERYTAVSPIKTLITKEITPPKLKIANLFIIVFCAADDPGAIIISGSTGDGAGISDTSLVNFSRLLATYSRILVEEKKSIFY